LSPLSDESFDEEGSADASEIRGEMIRPAVMHNQNPDEVAADGTEKDMRDNLSFLVFPVRHAVMMKLNQDET